MNSPEKLLFGYNNVRYNVRIASLFKGSSVTKLHTAAIIYFTSVTVQYAVCSSLHCLRLRICFCVSDSGVTNVWFLVEGLIWAPSLLSQISVH